MSHIVTENYLPTLKAEAPRPVARIEVDAHTLEWLIGLTPNGDLFKVHLQDLRDAAKDYTWSREVTR